MQVFHSFGLWCICNWLIQFEFHDIWAEDVCFAVMHFFSLNPFNKSISNKNLSSSFMVLCEPGYCLFIIFSIKSGLYRMDALCFYRQEKVRLPPHRQIIFQFCFGCCCITKAPWIWPNSHFPLTVYIICEVIICADVILLENGKIRQFETDCKLHTMKGSYFHLSPAGAQTQ